MDSDSDPDIDPEMAAAMGFTSFGAKPTKRRKVTHNTSVIEDQEGELVTVASSGANSAPLGVRSRLTRLEEGGEDQGVDANEAHMDIAGEQMDMRKGPEKGKGRPKEGAPMGLADYISWGNSVAAPSSQQAQAQSQPTGSVPTHQNRMPATAHLNGGNGASSWPQGVPSREELGSLRRGVQNARGDMAYFLPSFIEDPWKGLME